MIPHDLFAMYTAKATEYLIAIGYLLLFIPFWHFVQGGKPAAAYARAARQRLDQIAGWFAVPERVYFHPGHAWARPAGNGVLTVGLDEFAQKLVGDISAVALPPIGARLGQGEKGWSLISDAKAIDMLSPVDGTVAVVNDRLIAHPELLQADPYGEGWLMKVQASRPTANLNQLLSGALARRWMEEATGTIQGMMSPDLGRLSQDGGAPVQGMARRLSGGNWEDVCKRFFLTGGASCE